MRISGGSGLFQRERIRNFHRNDSNTCLIFAREEFDRITLWLRLRIAGKALKSESKKSVDHG